VDPRLQFDNSTTPGPLGISKDPLPFMLVNSSNNADSPTIPVDVPPAKAELLTRAHASCKGHGKEASMWRQRRRLEKRPSLLCRQHRHFSTLRTWKLNPLCRIREEQLPTNGLPDCGPQNGVCVSNRPCLEFPVDHDLICGLDFKRRERGQDLCTNCRTDVSTQHGCVVAVRLCPDSRSHGSVQPMIQEFIDRDLQPCNATGEIAFMQPSRQVRLCVS
jgi:hypothetical protein